jgi:putative PIN family toxin of toxin-antitoxin system
LKRVVLDTNVTISAFFWKGHPRTVFELVRAGEIIMLVNADMENEFIRVLGYRKFGLSATEIVPFIGNVRNRAEFIGAGRKLSVVTADPTDNIFLECAINGHADYIISGDRHLLDLVQYNGIRIFRPKEFLIYKGYLAE